jgi:hypothetical protein
MVALIQIFKTIGELFQGRKMVSCFPKCKNYCIYYVTYVRTEEIEETPPPLEENRGDLG